MRGVLVLFSLILAAPAALAADCPQPQPETTRFTTTELRLRAAPSETAPVLAVLPSGTRVETQEASEDASGGWAAVQVPATGRSGHVAARYLTRTCTPPRAAQPAPSDDQIADILIRRSIANYPGACPCPYTTARNGSRCGRRSAYSRPGGHAPLCYRNDVTPEMIARYRGR